MKKELAMNTSRIAIARWARPAFLNELTFDPLAVGAILAAVLLWGGSYPAMRVAVGVLSPWAMMAARMIVALTVILPFAPKLIPNNFQRSDLRLLLPMVLFQPCLYFLCESHALVYTTSAQAGVISAFVPLFVTVGAWLVLAESITRNTVAGLAVSIAGVAGLTLFGEPGGTADNPLLGNTLELLAMACAAANMVAVKRLSSRYNPWTLTAMQVCAGTVFFSPGFYFAWRAEPEIWSPGLILTLCFLGAFVTLGAFGLYNWGMSRIPASKASSFINLVPVAAVILGWTLLSETLSPVQWAAAATVIAGVALGQYGGGKRDD